MSSPDATKDREQLETSCYPTCYLYPDDWGDKPLGLKSSFKQEEGGSEIINDWKSPVVIVLVETG